MKQSKTLALLVVLALAITAIFALTACTQDPTVEGITVEIIGGGTEIALTQSTATADAIKGKIKVTANYSDETAKEVEAKDYTVEGLDTTKLNVAQDVTIKYGEFTKKVSVKIAGETVKPEVTVTSIEVTINGEGEKVVLDAETASLDALKAAITVKTVKSDNSKQAVTDYTVEGFVDTKVGEDQTVTIKHSNKTATVTVLINNSAPVVTVADIKVEFEGEKVVLQKSTASEAALKALLTVKEVKSDETLGETITDYTLEGLDLAKVDEDQTVTVKKGNFTKTITVCIEDDTVPVYKVFAIVNGNAAGKTELVKGEDGKFVATITLAKGDKVVLKNSDDETINIGEVAEYVVAGMSDCTFTVADENATAATVDAVAYTVSLIVKHEGQEDKTIALTEVKTDDGAIQFETSTKIDLAKDDVVVIKDSKGATLDNYSGTFDGTITADSLGGFYVKLTNTGHIIYTSIDAKIDTDAKVVLVIDGVEATDAEFAADPTDAKQLVLKGYQLTENSVIVIKKDGVEMPWENSDFNGTIPHDGKYDFYVKATQVWVNIPAKPIDPSETDKLVITVNGNKAECTIAASDGEYAVTELVLHAGDVIDIKLDGEDFNKFQDNHISTTIAVPGTYTMYVKPAENRIWVVVPAVESVELFVGATKKADLALKTGSTNEWEIEGVALAANDVVTIKVNGEAYAVYKNSDTFSGTVTIAGAHSFYVKLLNANDLGIWTVVPTAE